MRFYAVLASLLVLASNAAQLRGKVVRVADGFAWHYKRFDNSPAYAQAETAARGKRLGLWADGKPLAPWDYRKAAKRK